MKRAKIEVRDTLSVSVEFRPPKKGEVGWWVDVDCPPERALREVLAGRDTVDSGAWGFGWVAEHDYPSGVQYVLDDPGIAITVHVTEVRVDTASVIIEEDLCGDAA